MGEEINRLNTASKNSPIKASENFTAIRYSDAIKPFPLFPFGLCHALFGGNYEVLQLVDASQAQQWDTGR
jgi:hypothetical protein